MADRNSTAKAAANRRKITKTAHRRVYAEAEPKIQLDFIDKEGVAQGALRQLHDADCLAAEAGMHRHQMAGQQSRRRKPCAGAVQLEFDFRLTFAAEPVATMPPMSPPAFRLFAQSMRGLPNVASQP
jgi:hypothetical protein